MKTLPITVKDVLREVGISRNTLYSWERKRKVPEPKRNVYGHRVYTKDDLEVIRRFAKAVFIWIE